MAIGDNSYGSVDEVTALTRHLLDGQSAFNSTTRPTLTEVEKFIDRASGVLNVALQSSGFTIPVSQATAKLALDDWVTNRAAAMVELTAPGLSAFSPQDEGRAGMFTTLSGDAIRFVDKMSEGLQKLGVPQDSGEEPGAAVVFTGQDAYAQRTDPEDSTLRQPRFIRGMFDGSIDDAGDRLNSVEDD